MTVAAGSPLYGPHHGHVRIFRFEDITFAREYGWCIDQFGKAQENGVIELSKENIEPSIENQNKCRKLCIEHGKDAYSNIIITGCEAIFGEASFNGCYMHTKPIVSGDGTNKHPCWVVVKEDTDPFKPYEFGLCQNSVDIGSTSTNDETLLGNKDNSDLCLKICIKEYEEAERKEHISGCEYDENHKSCYLYNKIHWKATKGRYQGHDNANKCWIKANYCTSDSDCNDEINVLWIHVMPRRKNVGMSDHLINVGPGESQSLLLYVPKLYM